jgi:hypothetical protein
MGVHDVLRQWVEWDCTAAVPTIQKYLGVLPTDTRKTKVSRWCLFHLGTKSTLYFARSPLPPHVIRSGMPAMRMNGFSAHSRVCTCGFAYTCLCDLLLTFEPACAMGMCECGCERVRGACVWCGCVGSGVRVCMVPHGRQPGRTAAYDRVPITKLSHRAPHP